MYEGAEHRFPDVGAGLDPQGEDFFETRPTEYRTGGALSWDD